MGADIRRGLARVVCRALPPVIAQRAREVLYPYRLARGMREEFEMRSCTGSRVAGNTIDYHLCRFYFHGYFEWRNVVIARAVCAVGDTVIEVGANVGTETCGYADVVGPGGRVFAFEPVPGNVAKLTKSLAANEVMPVTVRQMALAERPGTLEFVPPWDEHDSGRGRLAGVEDVGRGVTVPVEVSTLDALAEEIGPSRLIVMDVEGHELSVLRGGRSYIGRHRPVIVLEADGRWIAQAGATPHELYEELAGHSYRVFRISRLGLSALSAGGLATADSGGANWFAVCEREADGIARRVSKFLKRGALMPLGLGLNPLES